ncbi:[LysW]-lysine hydrolase [Candidatus Leptofilum sp.]|uniref:[LysW]-lysine hydrolase n=1 Tax=Candidatus Leptofilum sp. TaxID=3241576 RepID=UPI003B59CA52
MNNIFQQEDSFGSGVYAKRETAIVRGSGATVWDENGRSYLDCAAGIGVANVGHCHPQVVAAITAQASQLITCQEMFYNDQRAQFQAQLAATLPGNLNRVYLCNSGTEAIEAAIKFARLSTRRPGIVAAMRGFHGRTLGALSATHNKKYRQPFEPLVSHFSHVPFGNSSRLDAAITEQTAAVILEIVQGEGGVQLATPGFFHRAQQLCQERGALLIIDEVQTGFGRTGELFACEHYDLVPDLICLGKAMAGGMPMGAVGIGSRVQNLAPGLHGSTFGGNPLACATATAVLNILQQPDIASRAAKLGDQFRHQIEALNLPLVRDVRGLGLMIGIELRQRAMPYVQALMDKGIVALTAGSTVIRLLPPLTITAEELDRVVVALEQVLAAKKRSSGAVAGLLTVPSSVSARTSATAADQAVSLKNDVGAVGFLRRLVEIPSLSGEETAVANFLIQQMNQSGFTAYVDAAGNAVGERSCPNAAGQITQEIVLLSHMDTVPGDIPMRQEDGKLYGRGSVDAKGPLATFIIAATRANLPPGTRLIVVGAVEEESATSKGARFVASQYQPTACLIGEPSGWDGITLGYKGRLLIDACFTQPMSHTAGADSGAAELGLEWYNNIVAYINQFNAEKPRLFDQLLPSVRELHTSSDGLENRLEMKLGIRLPPNFDVTIFERWLREEAGDAGTIRTYGYETAVQSKRTNPLAQALNRAIRQAGSVPTYKHKTGTSDMNVVEPVWNCPIVAYGPGDSKLDHTPNEHIIIAEYLQAIQVLETMLTNL